MKYLFLIPVGFLFTFCSKANVQQQNMVRLAKLEIDPAQLTVYKAALKEEIETSLHIEPGVLTLYAMSDKKNPAHITILEIYADSTAYKAHLQTPHFLKYKSGTKDMVKSLELIAIDPLMPDVNQSIFLHLPRLHPSYSGNRSSHAIARCQ